MTTLHLAIDIAAAPATVFGWLATPERARVWMHDVTATEILDARPGMVGTTFRETVSDASGSLEMRGTVTAYEPDRRISFHLESRANRLDVEYAVEPAGGGTRLTVNATIRWALIVRILTLLRPGFERSVSDQMLGELMELKRLCEAGESPPAGPGDGTREVTADVSSSASDSAV